MAEVLAQQRRVQDVGHAARAPTTVAHQQQRVAGGALRQVHVMPDHHHGLRLFAAQLRQQPHDADLVAQVERVGRLVEQDQRRVLRQHGGDRHALALAAGKRADIAFGQVVHVHRLQRGVAMAMVDIVLPVTRGAIRMARSQHGVDDAVAKGVAARLRQKSAPARQRRQWPRKKRAPVERDLPGRWRAQAGQGAQQGAFSRAVAADHAPAFARRGLPVEFVEQQPAADREGQVVCADHVMGAAVDARS